MRTTPIQNLEIDAYYFTIKAKVSSGVWKLEPKTLDSLEYSSNGIEFMVERDDLQWRARGTINFGGLLTIKSNCDWFAIWCFYDLFLRGEHAKIALDDLDELTGTWDLEEPNDN